MRGSEMERLITLSLKAAMKVCVLLHASQKAFEDELDQLYVFNLLPTVDCLSLGHFCAFSCYMN